MTPMVKKAFEFAKDAHGDQKRKYTGDPYISHPLNVMQIVASVPHTEAMLAAALLHDVLEDTNASESDILEQFGPEVLSLVKDLTDVSKPENGNRAARKAIDRQHTANASPAAKTIKLADLMDNTYNIVAHDQAFAKVYMAEKRLLLTVLTEGDVSLWKAALHLVEMSEQALDKHDDRR